MSDSSIELTVPQPHYVYLIQSETTSHTKIGISHDPKIRIKQIKLDIRQPLAIRATVACPGKRAARDLEKLLHRRFASDRLYGEWFGLTPEEILKDAPEFEGGYFIPKVFKPVYPKLDIEEKRTFYDWWEDNRVSIGYWLWLFFSLYVMFAAAFFVAVVPYTFALESTQATILYVRVVGNFFVGLYFFYALVRDLRKGISK